MANGKHLGVFLAASLLSGCSTLDSVWSALAGAQPSAASAGRVFAVPTPKAETAPPPGYAMAATSVTVPVAPALRPAVAAVPAASVSTAGSPQAQGLRAELRQLHDDLARQNGEVLRLRQALAQDSASYYGTVATIHSRLQMGSAPGNPEVVAQWNLAQVALDRMSADIARLAVMSSETAGDSALSAQILASIKTASAGGRAVDDDGQSLQALDGEARSDDALVRQLVDAIADDITRQMTYLDHERTNLVGLLGAIRSGELYAVKSADGRYAAAASAGREPQRMAALSGSSDRRPLVVIRFRQPNVSYEDALYGAVRQALARRPSASFDLVAVAPAATTSAQVDANARASKHDAESVLRSLTGMGLPAARVSLSATTSAGVRSNEVQIYVR